MENSEEVKNQLEASSSLKSTNSGGTLPNSLSDNSTVYAANPSTKSDNEAILNLYKIALEGDIIKLQDLINKVNINQGIEFDISQLDVEDNDYNRFHIGSPPYCTQFFGKYVNTVGQTALHAASKGGHAACVQLLLQHGAKIIADIFGETPLHCAASYDRLECVELLLKAGANPDQKNNRAKYNCTPFEVAVRHGAVKVVFLMLSITNRSRGTFFELVEEGSLEKLMSKLSKIDKKYFDTLGNINLPFKNVALSSALCNQIEKISEYMCIEELHFSSCNVNDEHIKDFLVPLLSKLPHLRKLCLDENQITYTGARRLASALANHAFLKSIDLSNNRITCTKELLEKLQQEFATCVSLEAIAIEKNFIAIEQSSIQEYKVTTEVLYQYNIFQTKPKLTKSMLDKNFNINQRDWVVSLVCKKGIEHSMIYMEGMYHYGQRFLERYHITAEGIICFANVLVENPDLKFFDPKQYHMESRKISDVEGKILKDLVESDKKKPIAFSMTYPGCSSGRVNCLKWCLNKLGHIDIHIDENLFGLPSGTAKGSKCTMM